MSDWLLHLPEWLSFLVVFVPLMVAGGLVVIGITDKKYRETSQKRQEEATNLQKSIRDLYKEESDALKEKIDEQNQIISDVSDRLTKVEAENAVMKSILQGTDPKTGEYRKRVEATLNLVEKLSEVIMQNCKKSDKILSECLSINQNIEKLTKVIAKK